MSKQNTAQVSPVRTHYTRPVTGRTCLYERAEYEQLLAVLETYGTLAEEVVITAEPVKGGGHTLKLRCMDPSHVALLDTVFKSGKDTWGTENESFTVAFRVDELAAALRQILAGGSEGCRFRLAEPALGSAAEAEQAHADDVKTVTEKRAALDRAQARYDQTKEKEKAAALEAEKARQACLAREKELGLLDDSDEEVTVDEEDDSEEDEAEKDPELVSLCAEWQAKRSDANELNDELGECNEGVRAANAELDSARSACDNPPVPKKLELAGKHETHKIRAIEHGSNDTPLPRIPYTHVIGLNSLKDFNSTLTRLKKVAEYVTVLYGRPAKNDDARLPALWAKGDSAELTLDYTECLVTELVTGAELDSCHSLEYTLPVLKALVKAPAASHFTKAHLWAASAKPMMLQVEAANTTLSFYLAPRVEN